MPKRKYQEVFLDHGFVNLPSRGEDRPQCVLCCKVLTNESLKASKLSSHLSNCHSKHQNQDRAFFQKKAKQLKGIQFGNTGGATESLAAAIEASYTVAYKVAKQQKSHTIAETLIMPCAKVMVSLVLGEDQAKKLSAISLSNNTVRRRIDDMADDILLQVMDEIKASPYQKISLQFDESTDVSSCAVLLGFVRYVHLSGVKEEFFLCESLATTTKGEDVYNLVDGFLVKNGLEWGIVQQVSVDGAPAMMGGNLGFKGFVHRANANITVDHCTIHRFALGSKTLPAGLSSTFSQVVKVVNFIKAQDCNSRVFKELCKSMGEKYEVLLYHTEVRWLSRGKVLDRVIELRQSVKAFLEQKGSNLAQHFSDPGWMLRLCYLGDIFKALNSANLALQGKNVTIVDARTTVSAFVKKLKLWSRRVAKGMVAQFPLLDAFLDEDSEIDQELLNAAKVEIGAHLDALSEMLEQYFPDLDVSGFQWLQNPWQCEEDEISDDDIPAKEEWIELRSKEALKYAFKEKALDEFWTERLQDTPTLAKRALDPRSSFHFQRRTAVSKGSPL